MREEKKYEILPGVEIPDIKKIQEAASDFSISEVGDVDIKTVSYEPVFEHTAAAVSPEELARLQALGVKVHLSIIQTHSHTLLFGARQVYIILFPSEREMGLQAFVRWCDSEDTATHVLRLDGL